MWQALHQTARQSVSLSVRTSTSRSGGFWVRLSCQFLLGCLRSIDLIGRPAAEDRVGSIGIVVADPPTDPCSCLTAGLEGIEVDAFVFQRSPQPLDEDVVHPAATAVHRDADVGIVQGVGEGKAGELRALIGVEDLGLADAGNRLLQCCDAEVGIHRVR